eukprot:TRINITY_DN15244_c0_g1_i1.p2 TRINITY_DN15244_c0_g1~~TRINITY_DN15244_c0_g1_i1.p2  ORF type:complete len:545 (+),score=281.95 TRINITY_DN15244_c0_g1_i1:60-1694(+)
MGVKTRAVAGLAGAIGVGGFAAGHYDEGIGRSQTFWARAFPIFLRYRWVQMLNRDLGLISDEDANSRYEALHEICSPLARDVCLDMRGFYLKNAQMMATREDFFPPQYIEWMRKTEDQAPTPFSEGDAEKIVAEELGRPLEEVFSFFDPVPSGVASIGQVHRAVLRDSGKEVAVKVQHWGAEELFSGDIRTQKNFCKWFMPQHVPAMDEIEKQHLTEFNYVEEAKNLDTIKRQIDPKWSSKIAVPGSHPEYCTKRVLTMDYLHGVKLIDGIRRSYRDLAERMGKSLEDVEEEQRRRIRSGELKLRSTREESQHATRVHTMVRVQDCAMNFLRLLANLTPFPYLCNLLRGGGLRPLALQWTALPLDLGTILETLIRVHGDQLFLNGSFNCDPHPGNILLMDDGRLGLIDFGQVKHLEMDARTALADIVTSLAKDDKEAVAAGLFRLGSRTTHSNVEVAYRLGAFWLDRDTDDIMTWDGKVLNIAEFIDAMEAADPVVTLAENLIMPGRMFIILRGLGLALGMRISMAQMMQPIAEEFLQESAAQA